MNPAGTIVGLLKGTLQTGEIVTPSTDKPRMVFFRIKDLGQFHVVDRAYLFGVVRLNPPDREVIHSQTMHPSLMYVTDNVAILGGFQECVRYHVLVRHVNHATSVFQILEDVFVVDQFELRVPPETFEGSADTLTDLNGEIIALTLVPARECDHVFP